MGRTTAGAREEQESPMRSDVIQAARSVRAGFDSTGSRQGAQRQGASRQGRSRRALSAAVAAAVEPLEARRLLSTTLNAVADAGTQSRPDSPDYANANFGAD